MRPVRIALLLAALGAAQAQAGVFDDDEARRQIADHRIKTEARFDQQAKAQLDLSTQIQRQAEEIARLRGQIETLSYELETAKKRQQDFYLDLDTRLRKFEAPASATAADPSGAAPATASADPAKESQEYEAALNQFKAGKYKDAAAGFAAFVQKYPASSRGRPLASRPPAVTGVTPEEEPLRDSTGAPAPSSGSGVVEQAASRAASRAGINSFFTKVLRCELLIVRAPGRFADVAGRDREALFDPAIAGHSR